MAIYIIIYNVPSGCQKAPVINDVLVLLTLEFISSQDEHCSSVVCMYVIMIL